MGCAISAMPRYGHKSDPHTHADEILITASVGAAADFMQTINNTSIPSEQNVSLNDFVESVHLPWIKQNRRPSTHKNARNGWRQHIRPLVSRERHFDGVNPVQGTSMNPRAREPEETYAYTLEEINSMLMSFPELAATAFAVAAFSGL
jgi:hypothetical protein